MISSCEEDTSFIGVRRANPPVTIQYAEIPLESSVLLMDSVGTFNTSSANQRLIAGKYVDATLGTMTATTYTQFRPFQLNEPVPSNAIFDSLVFSVSLDYYVYGNPGASTEEFTVHELTETLIGSQPYFSYSSATYNSSPLGKADLITSTATLRKKEKDNSDDSNSNNSIDTLKFILDPAFGQELLDVAKSNSSTWTDFLLFRTRFKGFAIVPSSANSKILGFTTLNDNERRLTRLVLYYHFLNSTTGLEEKRSIPFSLNPENAVLGFFGLQVDRTGTELQSLTSFFTDFNPTSGKSYVQSGVPITTRIDFSNYISYIDTISSAVLNSAELVLSHAVDTTAEIPSDLQLRLLKANNRFYPNNFAIDTTGIALFPSVDGVYLTGDDGRDLRMRFRKTNGERIPFGFVTEYCQSVFNNKKKAKQYARFALQSGTPPMAKSVHRLVLQNSTPILKIYYTKPASRPNTQ